MPNQFEVGIIQLLELDRVPSLNYLLDFTHKNSLENGHLVRVALERLLPESLLDDLLLRFEAAHLLHAQHQAELVELGRQQHLHVFYPFRRAYPNFILN